MKMTTPLKSARHLALAATVAAAAATATAPSRAQAEPVTISVGLVIIGAMATGFFGIIWVSESEKAAYKKGRRDGKRAGKEELNQNLTEFDSIVAESLGEEVEE